MASLRTRLLPARARKLICEYSKPVTRPDWRSIQPMSFYMLCVGVKLYLSVKRDTKRARYFLLIRHNMLYKNNQKILLNYFRYGEEYCIMNNNISINNLNVLLKVWTFTIL
jgi:hypothetical protein